MTFIGCSFSVKAINIASNFTSKISCVRNLKRNWRCRQCVFPNVVCSESEVNPKLHSEPKTESELYVIILIQIVDNYSNDCERYDKIYGEKLQVV